MRKVQFPHSGGDKSFGTNNVNNQKPNAAKKNNDLASALSGKSAPKFADATDAMEQLLADPTNESLRWEVMGFIKSSVPEDVPDVEEEDVVINAEDTVEAEAEAEAHAKAMAKATAAAEDNSFTFIDPDTGEEIHKRFADDVEENIGINADDSAKATAQASELAIVEGVEVKDPSDAMDKMLKGEISREGAMAYIKSTIPEGDIPYDD